MPTPVSQELLDVVDTYDRVTGVRTRGEVHSLGLMHRSVHILIFNCKGEMFIQKRFMTKDNNPGLWDSSAAAIWTAVKTISIVPLGNLLKSLEL